MAAIPLANGALLVTSYHRIRALPHVIPAPIAIIAIRSPGFSRPARLASSSEIGREALDAIAVTREVQPTFFEGNAEPPQTQFNNPSVGLMRDNVGRCRQQSAHSRRALRELLAAARGPRTYISRIVHRDLVHVLGKHLGGLRMLAAAARDLTIFRRRFRRNEDASTGDRVRDRGGSNDHSARCISRTARSCCDRSN